MKVKINSAKLLVSALFLLVSLLIGAIGLRLGIDEETAVKIFRSGATFGALSALLFAFGVAYPLLNKIKRGNPSKIRQRLTDSFNSAEANSNGFIRKLKLKNLCFSIYYIFVCLIGIIFFVFVSLGFFIRPATVLCLPLIFVAVNPLRRLIEYLLRKDVTLLINGGIPKDDFPTTYKFFEDLVERELSKDYKLALDFGSNHTLNANLIAKTVALNLNSYAFMLFSEKELEALAVRELRALKDKKCRAVIRLLNSRNFYLSSASKGAVFSGYFSFILSDTVVNFDFSKNALKRISEKQRDKLILGSEYAEDYLRAYKKQGVLDSYFGDARSFITLKICKDDSLLREFVSAVYNIFLDLIPAYGKEWEQEVESKLKAIVCSSLTYSEKKSFFGIEVGCGEIKNNCSEEQKAIYEKYNSIYYDSTKRSHEPKKRAIEGFYREVERFEQNGSEYDERLKLIGVAHAYYMTAQLDKAEEVYNKIIRGGDTTPEAYFDYGCFLLLAKKDKNGIDFIYKAMENENLVEEGFEVLGRHFIQSGDEEGYREFCKYKGKKLDEIINGFKARAIDKNAKFTKTELDEGVLNEIIEKLSKDGNIDEIYCADSKTRAKQSIVVFAVSVRNKTEEALFESYERVFSILDNDYGKYDTFLIAIDAEPDKRLIDRIKKDSRFRVYKK